MTGHILVVDDEEGLRKNIISYLKRHGYQAVGADSMQEAYQLLGQMSFQLVLADLRLNDGYGLDLVNHMNTLGLGAMVLFMTAYASIESAIDVFRSGACDYLIKPFSFHELGSKIENILHYRGVMKQTTYLRQRVQEGQTNTRIISKNVVMEKMMHMIEKVAPTRGNVLIYGKTGVGKELVARTIHEKSLFRDGLFVPLNIATIPDTLVESHLFGHNRGAFTGADKTREGAFRIASGGTLFLDEIGELPLHIQPKLLRALENREVTPIGSDLPEHVDTRVVAATNRDLEAMVYEGKFRQDLFMRINMFSVCVPALDERKDDIPLLVDHFLVQHSRALGKSITGVDEKAMSCLIRHSWVRGNVRELSNVIEYATIMCGGSKIQLEDLPHDFTGQDDNKVTLDFKTAVQQFERTHISTVLDAVNGNREQAAKVLGISLATLYRRLA